VKIGLGQVEVTMGNKAVNRAALLKAVEDAAALGCGLVVLPECGLAGWLSAAATEAAEPIDGPFCDELRRLARKHRMAMVAGLEERERERIYNSAVFIDEYGEVRTRHRKINELSIAKRLYQTGSSLEVIEWRGHAIGVLICADCWRPELVDALWAMGAGLILSPCAWAVAPGGEETNLAWIIETYRQRIGTRDLTIAAANGVGKVTEGPWSGRILHGNSLAVSQSELIRGRTNTAELVTFEYPFPES
jgi:predicted amidohydrolase